MKIGNHTAANDTKTVSLHFYCSWRLFGCIGAARFVLSGRLDIVKTYLHCKDSFLYLSVLAN